jgi:two-component system, chemotaxis family, protein-glutamate methylesterase/glutaminase
MTAATTETAVGAPPVVAMVASAGGIQALQRVLSSLDADLGAAVIVLLHLQPARPSLLAQVLSRSTDMEVVDAVEGEAIRPGTVYVAPPDAHLELTAEGVFVLDVGPPVHNLRPSADKLLASLAPYRSGRLAVILSGLGRDGSRGAVELHEAGGTVFAQDQMTAEHFGMPSAAIEAGIVDRIVSIDDLASAVREFVSAA